MFAKLVLSRRCNHMDETSMHHANSAVPQLERTGPVTMGLLWITMVTAFPSVLVGFEWYKLGITLPQVLTCALIAAAILLAYTIPVAQLSAKTGKGYGLLNQETFGKGGATIINLLLVLMFVGFYGLAALLLAEGLNSIFHTTIPAAPFAAGIALLMALNNFFGFSGVANFARFLAAPVLIMWVAYTFCKAAPACPPSVLTQVPQHSFAYALTAVSSFIIGFAIWGNESDYWRFGKARVKYAAVPLTIALLVGQVIFPATGWMVASISGVTDYAGATNFMTAYSFGGVAILGAIVLCASYFACNDSNLFGSSTAVELMCGLKHKTTVAILAVSGSLVAYALAASGTAQALETCSSINCVLLPTPTVIVLANWFISRQYERGGYFACSPNRSACIALFFGISVGLLTSGVLPGLKFMQCGIPCLQGWFVAVSVFSVLRMFEYQKSFAFAFKQTVQSSQASNANMSLEAVRERV